MMNIVKKSGIVRGVLAAGLWTMGAANAAPPSDSPVGQVCNEDTLIVSVTLAGSGQKPLINETLTTTFYGRIISTTDRSPRNLVAACQGGKLDYEVTSTVGTASCKLDGMAVSTNGSIKVDSNPHSFECTNGPEGQDKDRFRIMPAKI